MSIQLQELVGKEIHYNNQRSRILTATLEGNHVCCHIQNGNSESQNLDLIFLMQRGIIVFADPAITIERIMALQADANAIVAAPRTILENERCQILDYLTTQRRVTHLVHFTYLYNLRNILKHGILPVDTLERRHINYKYFDRARFDRRRDCSSFSITFPNYRVLFIADQEPVHLVILTLSIDVLSELPIGQVAYLPTNAATAGLFLRNDFSGYTGINAAKKLFCENVVNGARHATRQGLQLPLSYTSNPQAEVFIQGPVPPEFIKKVYVHGNDNYAFHEAEREIADLHLRVDVAESEDYFRPREDYRFWQ